MWYSSQYENKEISMIKINSTQLWVHDQDEALAFYTEKIGMVVKQDVSIEELDGFRWLTVGIPDQEVDIVLMAIPDAPMVDAATKAEVESLMAKGFAGTIFLETNDIHADYNTLKSRGVEFIQEPTEAPYGIDTGFHDPSGNSLRLTQVSLP